MGCLAGLGALWSQRHRQRRIPGQAVEEVADAGREESPAMSQAVDASSEESNRALEELIQRVWQQSGKTWEELQQEFAEWDYETWRVQHEALVEAADRAFSERQAAIREEAERRARFTAHNIRNDPEVVSELYTQLALAEPEEFQVFPPSEPRFWEQTAGQWTWANCKVYIHACLLSSTELVVRQVERCILGSPEASYGISLLTQAQITWLLPSPEDHH